MQKYITILNSYKNYIYFYLYIKQVFPIFFRPGGGPVFFTFEPDPEIKLTWLYFSFKEECCLKPIMKTFG